MCSLAEHCSCSDLVSLSCSTDHVTFDTDNVTVDAYRNKMRSTMVAAGQDVVAVAPHFETRVGKRKWLERSKRSKREASV